MKTDADLAPGNAIRGDADVARLTGLSFSSNAAGQMRGDPEQKIAGFGAIVALAQSSQ
jgi:hypothetical protein